MGSKPIALAAVASVATTSFPTIIRSILTGDPSVGPRPSIPTKPSMTVTSSKQNTTQKA